jgi:hypothetical protein
VLINTHCDIGEVAIWVEFDQRSKPMKCVWGVAQRRLDFILQLFVIGVEDGIGLPLLVHVARVPQCTKFCGQWFEGFNL